MPNTTQVPQSKPKTTRLTQAQEAAAFGLIAKGGPDGEKAREMFVYFNQPLVGSVAKKYRDKGLSWEELLSAGNVGLMKAVAKFQPSRGLKFSTCAVRWIKGEICELFDKTNKQKLSDRRVRQTESGVPLVFEQADDVVTDEPSKSENVDDDEEIVDGAKLQEDATTSEIVEDNPFHPDLQQEEPTLENQPDLQEAVAQDAELKEVAPKGAKGCEKDAGGLGLNSNQARSEGIGSVAGCAEFGNMRGEDPQDDGTPGGGYAINLASDSSIASIGADNDIAPALEEAIERLEDLRQALIYRMHLGLGEHERHTFKQIGDALDISGSRAEFIYKEAFARLREDPTLELLFESIQ